jgi:hypothetical protein
MSLLKKIGETTLTWSVEGSMSLGINVSYRDSQHECPAFEIWSGVGTGVVSASQGLASGSIAVTGDPFGVGEQWKAAISGVGLSEPVIIDLAVDGDWFDCYGQYIPSCAENDQCAAGLGSPLPVHVFDARSTGGSFSFRSTVSLPVEIWIELEGPGYDYGNEIFHVYGQDYNPGGLPPHAGRVYYKSAGHASFSFWYEAIFGDFIEQHHTETGTIELGSFDEWYGDKIGGQSSALPGSLSGDWGSVSFTTNSMNLSVSPTTFNPNDLKPHVIAYLYRIDEGGSKSVNMTTKNWDGTDGSFSISKSETHSGKRACEVYQNNNKVASDEVDDRLSGVNGEVEINFSTDDLVPISTVKSAGEPQYPFEDGIDPSYGHVPMDFGDRRTELDFPEYSVADVIKIKVPESKKIIDFLATDTWSLTSGSATFADAGDDYIKVTVGANGADISTTAYTDDVVRGARYAALVYSSDDGSKITLKIGGKTYHIKPTEGTNPDEYIDLLNPDEVVAGTSDITQSHLPRELNSQDPTWGWGLNKAGTIELKGLRANKVYYLKTFSLKRKSDWTWHGFRCPWITDAPMTQRDTDPFSMFATGDYDRRVRMAIITFDGIVGAEFFGINDTYSIPEDVWLHVPIEVDDSSFMLPSSGFVELTVLESDHWALFLPQGKYVSSAEEWTTGISAYVKSVTVPYGYGCSRSGTKYLRGQPAFTVVGNRGKALPAQLETYLNDVLIDSEDVTVPTNGIYEAQSKPQSHMAWGTITAVDASGSNYKITVSGLNDRDYTGFGLFVVNHTPSSEVPTAFDILSHNTSTGLMELDASSSSTWLAVDQVVSVHLPLTYKLLVRGSRVPAGMRNRNRTFAAIKVIPPGLLLRNSAGKLLRSPAGKLLRS